VCCQSKRNAISWEVSGTVCYMGTQLRVGTDR